MSCPKAGRFTLNKSLAVRKHRSSAVVRQILSLPSSNLARRSSHQHWNSASAGPQSRPVLENQTTQARCRQRHFVRVDRQNAICRRYPVGTFREDRARRSRLPRDLTEPSRFPQNRKPWFSGLDEIERRDSVRPRHRESGEQDLFRSRLDQIIGPKHAPVKLPRTINWRFHLSRSTRHQSASEVM